MWILPDGASTVIIFSNKKLVLRNIWHCTKGLHIYTNGGTQDMHHMGVTCFFWHSMVQQDSLATMFSLAVVRKICHITMNSGVEAAMIIHKYDGKELKFIETAGGLYYYQVEPSHSSVKDCSFTTITYTICAL